MGLQGTIRHPGRKELAAPANLGGTCLITVRCSPMLVVMTRQAHGESGAGHHGRVHIDSAVVSLDYRQSDVQAESETFGVR